ncbi:MAG TPA: DUF167 family protein [Alphaproteobacteria bacterium]|nr:DUF167 family protein [Alphaproteobacteria bacterium]
MKFKVKLTPSSRQNTILGWENDVLKCAVTAAPEKGKANAALIALLAKNLPVAKTSIRVIAGTTNRRKTIEIQDLEGDIRELFETTT